MKTNKQTNKPGETKINKNRGKKAQHKMADIHSLNIPITTVNVNGVNMQIKRYLQSGLKYVTCLYFKNKEFR